MAPLTSGYKAGAYMGALYATLVQVRITDAEWHAIAKQDCNSMLLYVVIGYQHDLLHVRESVDMLCSSMVRLKAQCWS